MSALPQSALDQLFLTARTYNEWSDLPVAEHTVRGQLGTPFPRNPRLTFEEAGHFR